MNGKLQKIIFGQLNVIVGDIDGSVKKIIEILLENKQVKNKNSSLLIFPELCIGGYPPRDLLLSNNYVNKVLNGIKQISQVYKKNNSKANLPPCILGAPLLLNGSANLINAAIIFNSEGKWCWQAKEILPNYDVFFEKRYFTSANILKSILKKHQHKLEWPTYSLQCNSTFIILICEDMWCNWNAEKTEVKLNFLEKAKTIFFEKNADKKPETNFFFNNTLTLGARAFRTATSYNLYKNNESLNSNNIVKKKLKNLLIDGYLNKCSNFQLAINISASPFELGKKEERVAVALHTLTQFVSARNAMGCDPSFSIALVNQVGANDELLFDGNSFLLSYVHTSSIKIKKNWEKNIHLPVKLEKLSAFCEQQKTILFPHFKAIKNNENVIENKNNLNNFENKNFFKKNKNSEIINFCKNYSTRKFSKNNLHIKLAASITMQKAEEILSALVMGVRCYAQKNGFNSAIIGLSGGIDSAVTAAIAAMAMGSKNVTLMAMPSKISSSGSVTDAVLLAKNIGCELIKFPINFIQQTVLKEWRKNKVLPLNPLAKENLQSRIRGLLLMGYSNSNGALLLSTGNKSEIATGYCTLYGDTNGGLSVLGDCYKSDIYALAIAINKRYKNTEGSLEIKNSSWGVIPENTFFKPPSAELFYGQQDDDELPPYDVLDAILFELLQRNDDNKILSNSNINFDVIEKVKKLVFKSEYKRKQLAPVLRISYNAFGMGRIMPITAKK